MKKKVVYLMRGVPSSGKSYRAKKLAGKNGVVCETDSFRKKTKTMDEARELNMKAFKAAIKKGITPIVVDRGNNPGPGTKEYALTALNAGYSVKIKEPTSTWWKELTYFLMYLEMDAFKEPEKYLEGWAKFLAAKSSRRVPVKKILRSLKAYKLNVSLEDILNYTPKKKKKRKIKKETSKNENEPK